MFINKVSSNIFKKYDIRGNYKDSFSFDNCLKIVNSFLSLVTNYSNKKATLKIAIAFDDRLSSLEIKKILFDSLFHYDVEFFVLGQCPTSVLYWYVKSNAIDGGIMITASHNNENEAGFKFIANNFLFCDYHINLMYNLCSFFSFQNTKYAKKIEVSWHQEYNKNITKIIDINKDNEYSFAFINTKNLSEKIIYNFEKIFTTKSKNIDNKFEFSFDQDCDRLIVCFNNKILSGFDIKMLFIKILIAEKKKYKKVIVDIKTHSEVINLFKQNGFEVLVSQIGHSFIKKMMAEEDVDFAIEDSGHIYFKDNYNLDDPFFATVKIINFLSKNNIQYYPNKEHYLKKEESIFNQSFIQEVSNFEKEINHFDFINLGGKKFFFKNLKHVIIRKSNTENLIQIVYTSGLEGVNLN